MRTLQEKYNGINEGKFTKQQFLRDARLEQPNLVTQFNGYDDAVQILKNRGMIVEAKKEVVNEISDILRGFLKGVRSAVQHEGTEEQVNQYIDSVESNMRKPNGHEKYMGWKESDYITDFNRTLTEAKLTKKSLTDYRYKPTNDMDKYPYEQILRGLRVELEGLNVLGTPTPEEYKKALAKVLKNLEKDSIFYTNQVAGVKPKAKRTDVMIDATPKNEVDKENGLKKAALKEATDPDIQELVLKLLKKNPSMTWTQGVKKVKEDLKDNKSQKDQLKEAIKGVIKNILSEGVNLSPEGPQMFEDEVYEMQGPKTDAEYRAELGDYLNDNQMMELEDELYTILTDPNEETVGDKLWSFLEDYEKVEHYRNLMAIFRDYANKDYPEDDEIDYDDENFSDPFIDGDLEEAADSEADRNMVRNFMTMYETEPSKFERLHKQAQTQAATTKDIKFKHLLSLLNRAKAGALQSLANQDRYQAGIEGMDESISLKDIL